MSAETKADVSAENNVTINEAFTSPIIKVKVGKKAKEYRLHKALLIHHSGFFRGALSSSIFKEAEDGIVELTDVRPETFNVFIDVMYSGTIAPVNEWFERYPESVRGIWRKIMLAYIFADKYLATEMAKLVLKEAYEECHVSLPWYANVITAFDNLPAGSPFLQLLVDVQSDSINAVTDTQESQEAIDRIPNAFLYRVMIRLKEIRKSDDSALRPRAYYNEPMAIKPTLVKDTCALVVLESPCAGL